MISFESHQNPGQFLTFAATNNWLCLFQEPLGMGAASANEASFKVIKYGLAEWDRKIPRDEEDIYNAVNLLSFESASNPNHFIRLNESDLRLYLSPKDDSPEFNEEATWYYDI